MNPTFPAVSIIVFASLVKMHPGRDALLTSDCLRH